MCPVAAKSGAESGSVPGGGEEQRESGSAPGGGEEQRESVSVPGGAEEQRESGSVPGGGEERRGREILQQGRPWRRTRRPARPALAAQLPWCLLQAVWSLEAALRIRAPVMTSVGCRSFRGCSTTFGAAVELVTSEPRRGADLLLPWSW